MKKLSILAVIFFLSLTFSPHLNAAFRIATTKPVEYGQASPIMARVSEIKSMDKSNLSSVQRKELRNELRSMKKQIQPYTVVYISGGALLLIIIILLIVLL